MARTTQTVASDLDQSRRDISLLCDLLLIHYSQHLVPAILAPTPPSFNQPPPRHARDADTMAPTQHEEATLVAVEALLETWESELRHGVEITQTLRKRNKLLKASKTDSSREATRRHIRNAYDAMNEARLDLPTLYPQILLLLGRDGHAGQWHGPPRARVRKAVQKFKDLQALSGSLEAAYERGAKRAWWREVGLRVREAVQRSDEGRRGCQCFD